MKKLWKDNGGYALIYVLIVVLVLCAVAVSVCTAALKNYQAQERSIRQTQQLYQAEGEIEKFVALAEAEDVKSKTVSLPCASQDEAMGAAKTKYKKYLADLVSSLASGYTLTLDFVDSDNSDNSSCTFTLTYKNDTACIEIVTEISMALLYDVEPTTETPPNEPKYTARVSKAAHSYSTYTITHLTAEKGGTSE